MTDPGEQPLGVKDQRWAWPVDSPAVGHSERAGEGLGEQGLLRNAGFCRGVLAWPREGVGGRGWGRGGVAGAGARGRGLVPSLVRAPGGSGVQSSSTSPSPRGQRRSMAPGRDLGQRPGRQGLVARDWGSRAGRAGAGGGASAGGGVPASPGSPS